MLTVSSGTRMGQKNIDEPMQRSMGMTQRCEISYSLGSAITVYQTEIYTIHHSILRKQYVKKSMFISTDSESVKAFCKYMISSK